MRPSAYSSLVLALFLAACGSVPKPFEGVERNEPIIDTILVNPGVMVAPIAGAPPPINQTLAEDVAEAMVARDVAAVTRGAARSISLLQGTADTYEAPDGSTHIRIDWSLSGPNGLLIDMLTTDVAAFAETADDPWLVYANTDLSPAVREVALFASSRLVRATAAPPLGLAAAPAAASLEPYHVVVQPVSGAPGDGNGALAAAMRSTLRRSDMPVPLIVKDIADTRTFTVIGSVRMRPANNSVDVISLVWEVRTPEGDVLGNVAQENAVPHGSLDGAWGDNALFAAESAAGGILTLLVQVDPGELPPE